MKTIDFFKTLVLSMAVATMTFTSCDLLNKEDNNVNDDTSKIHSVPITVKVTRDDSATKATYNAETKKLAFSEGDQLLIVGETNEAVFSALLNYDSGTSFKGELDFEFNSDGYDVIALTEDNQLLKDAHTLTATLLPAGYATYGYLSIDGSGYARNLVVTKDNACVSASTSAEAKKLAIEQFSLEQAFSFDADKFSLRPQNMVANYTIGGFDANTAYDNLKIVLGKKTVESNGTTSFEDKGSVPVSVQTDENGDAFFGVAFTPEDSKDLTLTYYVGDKATVSVTPEASTVEDYQGSVYNVTRNGLTSSSAEGTLGIYKNVEAVVVELNGTKYAISTMNLGARTVEDYGTYCTWGDANVASASATPWFLPYEEQLTALMDLSGKSWVSQNGVNGYKWTIGSRTLFIPAGGYKDAEENLYNASSYGRYWSSTDFSEGCSVNIIFDSTNYLSQSEDWYKKQSVRFFCTL